MKINISKKLGAKLLTMLLIFQAVFVININSVYGKSYYRDDYDKRTGKGYWTEGVEERNNMNITRYVFGLHIGSTSAPFGRYKITKIQVKMDAAMLYHERHLKTDWGTFKLRDAVRNYSSWERDYTDTITINKIVDFPDRKAEIDFVLETYKNGYTGLTAFGSYVEGTVYYEYLGPLEEPNTPPVVSIIQPSSGQSFLKYQKLTLKYNAYDVDGNTMTGTTSVNINGSWQTIDTRTGIKNAETTTVNISDSVWRSLPSNVNVDFRVILNDGKATDSKSISIQKLNNLPSVTITEPTQSLTLRTDQPPTVKARVNDSDGDVLSATLQYLDGSTWRDAVTNTNLASGQTTSLLIPNSVWQSLSFNREYQFRVKVNDGDSNSYSGNTARVTKINTAPNVAILKPVMNEKMFWGTCLSVGR